jgi:putative transposase
LRADENLLSQIKKLKLKYPTLSAKKLSKLLSKEKSPVNHKRVARIIKENNLLTKKRKRRRRIMCDVVRLPIPINVIKNNTLWSLDFMCSRNINHFTFMLMNVVDVYSKISPCMTLERSFMSVDVTHELEKAIRIYGKPAGIITDNGVEFTAAHFRVWCKSQGIEHYLTNKGSPAENCYVESFNSCVRREVLDANDFRTLNELRDKIEKWRNFYNKIRPHGSLNFHSPENYHKRAVNY